MAVPWKGIGLLVFWSSRYQVLLWPQKILSHQSIDWINITGYQLMTSTRHLPMMSCTISSGSWSVCMRVIGPLRSVIGHSLRGGVCDLSSSYETPPTSSPCNMHYCDFFIWCCIVQTCHLIGHYCSDTHNNHYQNCSSREKGTIHQFHICIFILTNWDNNSNYQRSYIVFLYS